MREDTRHALECVGVSHVAPEDQVKGLAALYRWAALALWPLEPSRSRDVGSMDMLPHISPCPSPCLISSPDCWVLTFPADPSDFPPHALVCFIHFVLTACRNEDIRMDLDKAASHLLYLDSLTAQHPGLLTCAAFLQFPLPCAPASQGSSSGSSGREGTGSLPLQWVPAKGPGGSGGSGALFLLPEGLQHLQPQLEASGMRFLHPELVSHMFF